MRGSREDVADEATADLITAEDVAEVAEVVAVALAVEVTDCLELKARVAGPNTNYYSPAKWNKLSFEEREFLGIDTKWIAPAK